jgi:SAM-dependent methyltransferase
LEESGEGSASARVLDDYYTKHYKRVHSKGCLGAAAAVMHRRLERGRNNTSYPITLELGAGNLEHHPFVEHPHVQYIASDIRIPPRSQRFDDGVVAERSVHFLAIDALRIPFADHSVDRIVVGCLLMHLADPFEALSEWQRVCRPDGVIDWLVPCDPGVTSRVFRRLVSQRTAEREGVPPEEYRLVHAIDHLNPFTRVWTIAKAAVEPDRRLRVRFFPFPAVASWNLNVFAIFTIEPRPPRT